MHKLLMSLQHIPLYPGPTFYREKKQINGNCIFLIIFNCSIFHHPKLNCKANFHTKYQIKLQAVTNHMIYIKPYIWGRLEINTFPNLTSCVTDKGSAGSQDTWKDQFPRLCRYPTYLAKVSVTQQAMLVPAVFLYLLGTNHISTWHNLLRFFQV